MIGIITLFIALGVQIGFFVYRLATKNYQTKMKHIIQLTAFATFSLLLSTSVYWWSFRWLGLFTLLAISAIFSVKYFITQPQVEREYKFLTTLLSCITGCIVLAISILPGILFPQFDPIVPTGSYSVDTTSVTFIDPLRIDPYSKTDRKLTVQFWYPANAEAKSTYPLAIFSHGSFGYRGSNLSTFEDLASNGYVVCSIDHSYHAFWAEHNDGSTTLVNMDFLNDVINITNNAYDQYTSYNKTHEWLDLRVDDINLVLNKMLNNETNEIPNSVYPLINFEKIGLFGHSLGGAAAAQLGRERLDVDAVIVVDGTMIGEEIDFKDGKAILNTDAYPLPLLNLYNDRHYEDALKQGTVYSNLSASAVANEAYDVVIRDSGHLNFTDLPLFSPTLARMLGTDTVDSRYCINTMNKIIRDFFDYTLKDSKPLYLQKEY